MDSKAFTKQATKVSLVSIIGNTLLTIFKLVAGIVANSGAMVSDAIHSGSDVFSSIIVIIGVRVSAKESDNEHPYGHERLECVAAIVLSTILAVTGAGIGYTTIVNILNRQFLTMEMPGRLALAAALISIISKEVMYWYTRFYAKTLDSSALMADAWHHRSDALSSIGALIGIEGARMGYLILEPIASIVICVFICKAAYDIFKDAIDKMVDKSCATEIEDEIEETVLNIPGVEGIDLLHTRMFGNKIYVDIEIAADGNKTLNETHGIAENVHDKLEELFPKIKHIMVHVNPKN